MVVLQIAFHPFGTELTLIDRELLPGLEADYLLVTDLELDAALYAAKAAVGFDQTLRSPRRPPASRWLIAEMRPVLSDELCFR
jgi:hypothetical protein